MSYAAQIVDAINETKPDQSIDLKQYISDYLFTKQGKNKLESLESLPTVLRSVKKKINENINDNRKKGIVPRFKFSEYSDDVIVGCYIFEKDILLKQKLLFREELYETIKCLDWDLFELLCMYILEIYNFEKVNVGKKTKDGGLDFFGYYIPTSKTQYLGFLTQLNSRIFGQSKHYCSPIGERKLRVYHSLYCDFLIEQGRAYDYVVKKQKWFLEVKGPFIPMFMTNNTFTGPAIDFANRKGIITREGVQIVEDLIMLSKDEPWFIDNSGEMEYSEKKFLSFLKNYS